MCFQSNKTKSRTAGKAGNTGHGPEYQQRQTQRTPRQGICQRPERRTAHAARRLSRKPREGPCRGRNKQTAGKTADSVRRLTVAGRGASVSRTAGQHDDAEKAGDTSRHAKAGKAAGRPRAFPISHRRAATGGGNEDGNSQKGGKYMKTIANTNTGDRPSLNILYGPALDEVPAHIKCDFCKKYRHACRIQEFFDSAREELKGILWGLRIRYRASPRSAKERQVRDPCQVLSAWRAETLC